MLEKAGAPDRIRTCDLCLRRAALYPAELRVHGAMRCALFLRAGGRLARGAWRRYIIVPALRAGREPGVNQSASMAP